MVKCGICTQCSIRLTKDSGILSSMVGIMLSKEKPYTRKQRPYDSVFIKHMGKFTEMESRMVATREEKTKNCFIYKVSIFQD